MNKHRQTPCLSENEDYFARAAVRLEDERPLHNPRLKQIADQLKAGLPRQAHEELYAYLATNPDDSDAVFLMAETLVRLGRRSHAEPLFARCLDLAPDFTAARFGFARLLLRLNKFEAALRESARLLSEDAGNPLFLQLKANALLAAGENTQALAIWKQLATDHPARAESWIKYGDSLRASGFQEDAVAAYRKAIACAPSPAQAWWSLANLKTFRFGDADMAAIEEELKRVDITADDRIHLLFALGKAYEDHRAWHRSFEHYAKANAAKRLRAATYPKVPTSRVAENRILFTPGFFHERSGAGCAARGPIFVLGQQRSGSTLVEQILSSHSAIEGAGELKYIPALALRLEQGETDGRGGEYPNVVERLDAAELTSLGEDYLKDAQVHRRSGRPWFVDKNPANYHYLGLILLILPGAKIIDVRRHPAATCLSIFKQHLGTASQRLGELGQGYRDYVELMAHFDRVLPGRVHRVIYEALISDPESEIRTMLDHLELPFEDGCLRFYDSARTVLTPSSEQVRRPLSAEAIDHWRNFEPWLAPLLDSLGSVASAYPGVPEELL